MAVDESALLRPRHQLSGIAGSFRGVTYVILAEILRRHFSIEAARSLSPTFLLLLRLLEEIDIESR